IVLDLTMPGMGGEEVLTELARRGCRARIIVSSGLERARIDAAVAGGTAASLDMAGTLPKPFLPAALRALLA
ncbi:MAG: DNA-binding response regulator, partial [Rhizobacter sp.]